MMTASEPKLEFLPTVAGDSYIAVTGPYYYEMTEEAGSWVLLFSDDSDVATGPFAASTLGSFATPTQAKSYARDHLAGYVIPAELVELDFDLWDTDPDLRAQIAPPAEPAFWSRLLWIGFRAAVVAAAVWLVIMWATS